MTGRRRALKTIAGATGLAAAVSAQKTHQHADAPTPQPGDKPLIQPKVPKQPAFYNKDDFETLSILVDLIIPRTDTPGAKDAGVHYLVDERVPKDQKRRTIWRDGIADVNQRSRQKYGKAFASIGADERVSIFRTMSEEKGTEGRRFFELLKGAVVDAYYETREGLVTELGWHGNLAIAVFTGCTHPEHQS